MAAPDFAIKPGTLRTHVPFDSMPPEYVIVASRFARARTLRPGDELIRQGETVADDFFLTAGEMTLIDVDGTERSIVGGEPPARNPLPQLRPSVYTMVARTLCEVVVIPQEVVRRVRAEAPEMDPELEDESQLDITQTREFFLDFREELRTNKVRLPSLPESAGIVHRIVSRRSLPREQLAGAVSLDPSIAGKFVKMANGSLFADDGAVTCIGDAVTRLSAPVAEELALCFAFRDIYKNVGAPLMKRLKEHVLAARQVAAMAATVARITGHADPEEATLAGLLHNIGVLPVFSYAQSSPPFIMHPELVDKAIARLSKDVGLLMAERWNFGPDLTACIKHADNWNYVPGSAAGLVDVVVTARYHHVLSRAGVKALPKPREVASINAVAAGEFNEKLSIQILDGARRLLADQQLKLAS